MPERILVCVAWPYANYLLHVGQAAGAYLPSDIFARYHRLKGNEVLMVSGSDSHGTPITVAADKEGVEPRVIVDRYHAKILEVWERFGISFDLYTTTLTENHYKVTQEVFLKLKENGLLYPRTEEYLYDPQADRFLPDRYVEGTCPNCGYTEARGDQCDNCGKTLDAVELINPKSKISGATPILRPSEHYFLKLSAMEERLKEWVGKQAHWRRNVLNFTLGMLNEGLKDRAITRDIAWGVPVPVDGYDNKRIYVWFDAVIGYLSASKEWAQKKGDPEAWRPYWEDRSVRSYYFIGKDNIPFHTVIWPMMLMGYGGLNIPYDVPANQYVNFSATQKQSKSKGTGNWMLELLDNYAPDVVRFYLTTVLPETNDTEFREEDLIRANNDILIATWGNLSNRVISMIHRNFDGVVPETGALAPESDAILAEARAAFNSVGAEFGGCHFRNGLQESLRLAQAANKYLDERAPWKAVKTDLPHAAETLATALNVINALKILLHPVLPFSTAQLHEDLNLGGDVVAHGWTYRAIPAGTRLAPARPLYQKIETALAGSERVTGAFDTHSHIHDPKLLADFEGILERAAAAVMAGIAVLGYDAPSNALALELSARSPILFPAVGFHPHEADHVTSAMLAEMESLAALPEVIAVGEIGLDNYRHHSTEVNQRKLLEAQLEIALRVGKPVCIHSRAAESVAIDQLGPYARSARAAGLAVPGVMHCFGGTLEQALPYVEAGFVISVACTITYPKNEEAARLVRTLPLETLVIETDSPYLPPQGRRGQLNEPAYVVEAAKAIAALRGEPLQHVLDMTTRNAARLFRVAVGERGRRGMTQTSVKPLYGPVAEDMILVEDLLESIKQVELKPLKRMLDHALEARGKRLRPALVLLAGNLGDYNLNKLVPLGAAIELLHTASLVHDDVVDGAMSRRGRPTANAVFDNAITVLLGDYMFANAAEMVTRTGSLQVTRLFALALMKMTSGELDQDAAAFDVGKDVQQYLFRIGGKTAALIANATEGGAVLAQLGERSVEALRTYGYSLGMAFQIVDDILDFTGDEELMGKPVGSDLLEGTVTLPGLLFLERYPRDNPIKRFFTARRERHLRLQEAIGAILASDVIDASMDIARDYVRRAHAAIEPLPASPAKDCLTELGEYVLTRRS